MRRDRWDAVAWLVPPTLVALLVPIGFVSADGLGLSGRLAAGSWQPGPNHLLFEPLCAGWLGLFRRAGSALHPVDALKLLSLAAGGLAAALFRLLVGPQVAATRWRANAATAAMALSAGFLHLATSDEPYGLQLPLLVVVLASAVRHLERPSLRGAVMLGAAIGLAGLAFVSNLLLAVPLAAVLAGRALAARQPRAALAQVVAVAAGVALAALPPLAVAWWTSDSGRGFTSWLLTYGGGASGPRAEASYGLVPSASGVAEALLRAAYGAGNSVVDLTATAAAVRDRQLPAPSAALAPLAFAGAAAALLGAALALRRSHRRELLLVALGWVLAVAGFGIFWNNSDEQFWVQLTPLFGLLIAAAPWPPGAVPRWVALAGAAALAWNVGDLTVHRVLYPRAERAALLAAATRGACLVVTPGFDEAATLLAFAPGSAAAHLSIVGVAVAEEPSTGLPRLRLAAESCLAAGGRVVFVDVFDTPPRRSPWKYLPRLGYSRPQVEAALARLPGEWRARRAGPFTIREIAAPLTD